MFKSDPYPFGASRVITLCSFNFNLLWFEMSSQLIKPALPTTVDLAKFNNNLDGAFVERSLKIWLKSCIVYCSGKVLVVGSASSSMEAALLTNNC
jgi:hypothetical protein